jgi:hypothetical protein
MKEGTGAAGCCLVFYPYGCDGQGKTRMEDDDYTHVASYRLRNGEVIRGLNRRPKLFLGRCNPL